MAAIIVATNIFVSMKAQKAKSDKTGLVICSGLCSNH
jgi:hypothetical protein